MTNEQMMKQLLNNHHLSTTELDDARVLVDKLTKALDARMGRDEIVIRWSVDDVFSRDASLTATQASEVLTIVKRTYDANIGVNWEVIDQAIQAVRDDYECGQCGEVRNKLDSTRTCAECRGEV